MGECCWISLSLSRLLNSSFSWISLRRTLLLFFFFSNNLSLLGEFADDADEGAVLVAHFANVRTEQLHHLV